MSDEGFPIRKVLLGSRTMIFFAIFFALGAILPFLLNVTSSGTAHIGYPLPFHHDEGSIPAGRTWTEWDVLATDVAIYYAAAAVMGFVGVMRSRSQKS